MSLRPIGVRRPGVPSRQEVYYAVKIRSIELGGGDQEALEGFKAALALAKFKRVRAEYGFPPLPEEPTQGRSPINHDWLKEGF